jgi:hypothetical protein
MATMGRYCKAYSLAKLREFPGWTEKAENARKEKKQLDGKEIEERRALTDNDYVYLQENYVVTDGIFKDENIIFDAVTPEWTAYCTDMLKFEIPVYEPITTAPAEEQQP